MPQDDVIVHCWVLARDSELERVLREKRELIEQSIKQPVLVAESLPEQSPVEIIRESADVKGTQLTVVIINRSAVGQ